MQRPPAVTMAPTMRAFFSQPPFALAFTGNMFNGLSSNLFLHLPLYLLTVGADEVLIGSVMGISAITALAARVATGIAMDAKGQKRIIYTGHAITLGAFTLYLFIDGIGPLLWTARLMHGLSEGVLGVAYMAYAAELLPATNRARGVALFGISGMLPVALGGYLGDVVIGWWGFGGLFASALAVAGVATLTSFALPEIERLSVRTDKLGRNFAETLVNPALIPIWLAISGVFVAVTAYFTFVRTYLTITGLGSVGGFFAAYALTTIAFRVLAGSLPERLGTRRLLVLSSSLFAGGLLVLALASTDGMILAAGILCGAGHAYVYPALFALTVDRAPDHARASATAISSALGDVVKLIGAPMLGLVITASSYQVMFTVVGFTFLAMMAGAAVVNRRYRRA